MTDVQEVQSQLVTASGSWSEFESRSIAEPIEYAPRSFGWLSLIGIDALPRGVVQILAYRRINTSLVGIW